ncbi:MAG TPA: N-acetylneuraminate synthase family protein [Pseudolabrys sp.]|nr:N-acetylneuraminate synthase family protein [Pseudolabrys sp.]
MSSAFAAGFTIEGRAVGPGQPCLIIAEGGVNHFGEIDKAIALVDLAADAGADVFKTQHYRTDVLVGPAAPQWRDRLRSKELPDRAIAAMAARCKERGIIFMCTPHDHTALNFLAHDLGVSAFKIGSGEVENWPYLAAIAACRKPIILSTGMYTLEQIATAADVIAGAGGRELAILHCVTSYPAAASSINLDVMRQIREFFPGPVGYSDHTEGTAVCLAAVALGADVIEKHITIDRDVPNAHDWKVSCDPSNFARFVADIREVEAARGGAPKSISAAETQSIIWARKSLTAVRPIEAGETVSNDMLIAQRPGTGLPASQLSKVLGRKAARRIDAGEILQLDMLK